MGTTQAPSLDKVMQNLRFLVVVNACDSAHIAITQVLKVMVLEIEGIVHSSKMRLLSEKF